MIKLDEFMLVNRLSDAYNIPAIDLLLISMNIHGAKSELSLPRARMKIKFDHHDSVWQVILPLENDQSPYELRDHGIYIGDQEVAHLEEIENDDVVLSYLRAAGESITLNTNSRSNCIGCVFCPNIIEDAADSTIRDRDGLSQVLEWLCADQGWRDLAHTKKITVCSGCFRTPDSATRHMRTLREASEEFNFDGTFHLLSSVIREPDEIKAFVDAVGKSHVTFTLECFENRDLLLKESKASLTVEQTCKAMALLEDLGATGDFTYVAGLDSFDTAVTNLNRLIDHATTFPRIQVFQAHNKAMRSFRSSEAEDLEYFCKLRLALEPALLARGLKPLYWENYRPLWASTFAGEGTTGPRV